ncbi:MAG: hypothetical protein ABIJ21_07420 [Nanoarchaeota archaeon]
MNTCITCNKPLQPCTVTYKNEHYEAMRCPRCKRKVFTEDLALKALRKLESLRLQKEYEKTPLRIGNSIGITFPKDITRSFNLDNPKTRLKIIPLLDQNKIEIEVN